MEPLTDVRDISRIAYGFIASKALFAALELDLFSRLLEPKSIDALAQCASALKIAVTAMNRRNLPEPNRRAIGGPNAISQTLLSSTWVHEPWRKA